MGVFRLKAYVEEEGHLWGEDIELKDTRVVVDGSALLYHLYCEDVADKLDGQRGGQYMAFHDKIVKFFKRLEDNGVEPYVLLNGGRGKNLKTSEEILKWKIGNLLRGVKLLVPLLARQTFIQTIEDISGVQFAVCDG